MNSNLNRVFILLILTSILNGLRLKVSKIIKKRPGITEVTPGKLVVGVKLINA